MDSRDPGPLERIDHVAADGEWSLWRWRPMPALRPYVLEMEGYVERRGPAVVRDQLPVVFVPLIIVLGRGFALRYPHLETPVQALDRSFLAGLHRRPARVGSYGEARCMQVNFTPLGARRFLRSDLAELADRVVNLSDLLPGTAEELEERLCAAPDWVARFRLLEGMLARRILAPAREDPRLAEAWRLLDESGGSVRIERMAAELEVSRKHLNLLFRRQFGGSPKTMARIIRFSQALAELQRCKAGGELGLAQLALDCGYADQSHFTRDFSAFAGASPTAVARRMQADGTGVMAPEW